MSESTAEVGQSPHTPSTTRRTAMAAALALPLSSAEAAIDTDAIAQVVALSAARNAAFLGGDMPRWSSLARFSPDFTLMQPFGGPASHGFDASPERLAEMARYFRNGKTELKLAQSYASDGLVVLAMIEQQTAEVGGLPAQDWSLRVTEVYRKVDAGWELAHRHADPLVHRITLQQASALARGGAF